MWTRLYRSDVSPHGTWNTIEKSGYVFYRGENDGRTVYGVCSKCRYLCDGRRNGTVWRVRRDPERRICLWPCDGDRHAGHFSHRCARNGEEHSSADRRFSFLWYDSSDPWNYFKPHLRRIFWDDTAGDREEFSGRSSWIFSKPEGDSFREQTFGT